VTDIESRGFAAREETGRSTEMTLAILTEASVGAGWACNSKNRTLAAPRDAGGTAAPIVLAMIRKGRFETLARPTSGLNAASSRACSSWQPEPSPVQDHHAPPNPCKRTQQ
jgi:hypothetical protein